MYCIQIYPKRLTVFYKSTVGIAIYNASNVEMAKEGDTASKPYHPGCHKVLASYSIM